MYIEFYLPKLLLEISENYENDSKKAQKALKKAEKSNNKAEIIEINLFLSVLEISQNDFAAAMKLIDSLEVLIDDTVAKEVITKNFIVKAIIEAQLLNYEKAIESLNQALDLTTTSGNKILQWNVRENLGVVHVLNENYNLAEKELKEALSLVEKTKDEKDILRLNIKLGILHFNKKEYVKAKETFLKNVERSEKLQDEIRLIQNLRFLSNTYLINNENDEASKTINQAMELASKESSKEYKIEKAWCLLGTTELLLNDNKLLRAEPNLEESKKIFSEFHVSNGLLQNLVLYSRLLIAKNRVFEAEKLVEEASTMSEKTGLKLNPANLYEEIGTTLFNTFDKKQGLQFLEKAEKNHDKEEAPLEYAKFKARLGKTFFQAEDNEKAMLAYEESGSIFQKHENSDEIVSVNKLKIQLYISKSENKKAEKLLDENIAILREKKNDIELAKALRDLADLKYLAKDNEESIRLLKESVQLFEKSKTNQELLISYTKLLKRLRDEGREDEVVQLLDPVIKIAEKTSVTGNEKQIANVYQLKGDQVYSSEEYKQAKNYYTKSREILRPTFDNPANAIGCMKMARAYCKLVDDEGAYELIEEALSLDENLEITLEFAILLHNLSKFMKNQTGDQKKLIRVIKEGAEIIESDGQKKNAIDLYNIVAKYNYEIKEFENASQNSTKALQLSEEEGDLEQKSYAQYLSGISVSKLEKSFSSVFENLDGALSGYKKLGDELMVGLTTLAIGEAHILNNNLDQGISEVNNAIELLKKIDAKGELIDAYDILVDNYFISGSRTEASNILDKQITIASDFKKYPNKDRLKILYTKQTAINLSMNNFNNAMALIQHQLSSNIFDDDQTRHRLKCELGSICYILDMKGEALTALKEIDMKRSVVSVKYNPHDFYMKLKPLYMQYFMRIGRYSICLHMLGDIYHKRKKWEASFDNYLIAVSVGSKELKRLPPELALVQQGLIAIAKKKRENAKTLRDYLNQDHSAHKRYIVTGKAKFPCINCLGEGEMTVISDNLQKESYRCPTCNGKRVFVQKPPITQHLR